jgi:hypothetical protein
MYTTTHTNYPHNAKARPSFLQAAEIMKRASFLRHPAAPLRNDVSSHRTLQPEVQSSCQLYGVCTSANALLYVKDSRKQSLLDLHDDENNHFCQCLSHGKGPRTVKHRGRRHELNMVELGVSV